MSRAQRERETASVSFSLLPSQGLRTKRNNPARDSDDEGDEEEGVSEDAARLHVGQLQVH